MTNIYQGRTVHVRYVHFPETCEARVSEKGHHQDRQRTGKKLVSQAILGGSCVIPGFWKLRQEDAKSSGSVV